MAATNEVKIAIKAVNEATATIQQIQREVKALGGSVEQDMQNAGRGFKNAGKEVSGFKNFIKEAKGEQRQHNFVIGEMMDVLGGVSLAVKLFGGNSSETEQMVKQMAGAIQNGVTAFRGLETAIGLLGVSSGVGIAIAAIGAVAVAIASMSSEVDNQADKLDILKTKVNDYGSALKSAFGGAEINDALLKQLNIIQRTNIARSDELEKIGQTETAEYKKLQIKIQSVDKMIEEQLVIGDMKREYGKYINEVVSATAKKKNLTTATKELSTELLRTRDIITKPIEIKGLPEQLQKLSKVDVPEFKGAVKVATDEAGESFKIFSEVASFGLGVIRSAFRDVFSDDQKVNLRSILNDVISLVEGLLAAAAAAMWAKGTFLFGTTLASDFGMIAAATVGLEAARGILNSFHAGGGGFVNAPANRDVPVMVRGQETIRVTTPSQERKQGGGAMVFNFNAPVSDAQFVTNSIKKVLSQTGMSVDKVFVNQRNKLSFA